MALFSKLVDAYDFLFRVYMRLLSYLRPVREGQTFFGAKMSCDIRDFIQRRIYFFNIWEPNLTNFFVNTIRPGDVVVDVGANIGYFSLLASNLAGPSGKVISIEAAPQTYELLRRNLERNGCDNVNALNVAATLNETTVEIVRGHARNIGTNAIQIGAGPEPGGGVPGRPVSTLVGGEISRVGFIKIDIEGSEAPVLEDIIAHIGKFPQRLTIVAEITENSAKFVEKFRQAGFEIAALPNNYTIGYFLIRSYLRRSDEDTFVVAVPIEIYSSKYSDYVFMRS
jgi:FkbM family methyltransferase